MASKIVWFYFILILSKYAWVVLKTDHKIHFIWREVSNVGSEYATESNTDIESIVMRHLQHFTC